MFTLQVIGFASFVILTSTSYIIPSVMGVLKFEVVVNNNTVICTIDKSSQVTKVSYHHHSSF